MEFPRYSKSWGMTGSRGAPVWRLALSVLMGALQELGGVRRRGGRSCIQQQVLVLRQVLSRRLLGQVGTVHQFALQPWEVCLCVGGRHRHMGFSSGDATCPLAACFRDGW